MFVSTAQRESLAKMKCGSSVRCALSGLTSYVRVVSGARGLLMTSVVPGGDEFSRRSAGVPVLDCPTAVRVQYYPILRKRHNFPWLGNENDDLCAGQSLCFTTIPITMAGSQRGGYLPFCESYLYSQVHNHYVT